MKKNLLKLLVAGAVGAGVGGALTYFACRDNSPFGIKTTIPESFYGRQVPLGDLNREVFEGYLRGYCKEDTVIQVLDGKLLNIAPVEPSIIIR